MSCPTYKKYYRKKKIKNQSIISAKVAKGLSYFQEKSSKPLSLAIRSSAPFEDHSVFSLAGQFKTYLNVSRVEQVVHSVYKCWDSMKSGNVHTYMQQFNYSMKKASMGVLVQKMLKPDFAGVIFTKHPVTGDENVLLT